MAGNHDINQPNLQSHLLLIRKSINNLPPENYTLFADDDTFPQSRRILGPPVHLGALRRIKILNSIDGCQFFYGEDAANPEIKRVVMWNPTDVGVQPDPIDVSPNEGYTRSVVGFGVCPNTGLKLVKISVRITEVPNAAWRCAIDVYTVATNAWINVINDEPFMWSEVECSKVCVGAVLYFRTFHNADLAPGVTQRTNYFYSFNLETNVFGEVRLPGDLVRTDRFIHSAELNGSLALLDYHDGHCEVWTKNEGDNMFAHQYTITIQGLGDGDVLGFRNNGEAVVERRNGRVANIGLYDRLSEDINIVGITGNPYKFVVRPYIGNVNYD